MKGKELSNWSKISFLSAVGAAFFGAFYLANDTYIMHHIIICPGDPFTAISVYLILGSWIGVLSTFAYNAFLGKWLDKDYPGFTLGSLRMHIFASISGLIAAGSTVFCLAGNQNLDPSLVTALANLSIFYLVVWDSFRERISFRAICLPMLLILAGSAFTSVTRISGGFQITMFGIVILLIGRCGTDAAEQIVRQHGIWKSDPVTFNFWRFLWLAISATMISCIVAISRGTADKLFTLMEEVWITAVPWIFLTMLFVFFFLTFMNKAMKTGPVSKVSMVISSQVILGIPIAIVGNLLWPGIFGDISFGWRVWTLRSVGIVLIFFGVMVLSKRRKN